MTLIAAGVSHRTALVAERERLAVPSHAIGAALASLRGRFGAAVILSTCNRTEVYVRRPDGDANPADLMDRLADANGFDRSQALPHFYELEGLQVADHLFRVAAGVDSMILGEGQILGQVRAALRAAHQAGSLDPVLSRLMHAALETGKRARHETDIARFAVSVSSAAVDLARRSLGTLQGRRVLLVGAGEAGKLSARALRDAGAGEVVVANRTAGRAAALADYLGGRTVPFSNLVAALAEADLVIASSGAPSYVVTSAQVKEALARGETPITLIDVAVPRDIDPAVAALPGVRLFDIDDLQDIAEANLRLRERATADVIRIVGEATQQFTQWLEVRRAAPTITALVDRAEGVRREELERTARTLHLDDDGREKLDRMTAAIVKKLLHHPIVYLRNGADRDEADRTVRRVFQLQDD